MASVTYKNQPGIDKTKGNIPLAGTKHLYTVKEVLWPEQVSGVLKALLISPSLHVCSGLSPLGDVRADFDPLVKPQVLCNAAALPFPDASFASVLCDPPYNGSMQWNHDLLCELFSGNFADRQEMTEHEGRVQGRQQIQVPIGGHLAPRHGALEDRDPHADQVGHRFLRFPLGVELEQVFRHDGAEERTPDSNRQGLNHASTDTRPQVRPRQLREA